MHIQQQTGTPVPPRLEARAITAAYAGRTVLVGLNLAVHAGEIYALLGANGAGKTTTLSLFLGFLQPVAGSVRVNGIDPVSAPDQARRQLAYIPENVAIYEHLSARENIAYLLSLAGDQSDPAVIEQALLAAGLDATAHDRRAAGFSKGMRQKVAIALALALVDKRGAGRIVDQDDQTRAGAELPGAGADRCGQRLRQFGATGGEYARQCHHRIDGTEFAVKRNRTWTRIGLRLQRGATTGGTGKRARRNGRVADQLHAHFAAGALHHADQAGRQTQIVQYPLRQRMRAGRQLQVGGMRLDQHRAAGRQCGCGVVNQHAEGKRKITGREHGYRHQRHQGAHHRRMTAWRRAGSERLVELGERCAVLRQIGKARLLECGAIEFAIQAHRTERGFRVGDGDQLGALSFQRLRQTNTTSDCILVAAQRHAEGFHSRHQKLYST